jgi:DNA-directed RNA polymerase subunit RPC12/RpoP
MKNAPVLWHCSFCKRDVKFNTIGTDADEVRRCPDCRNNSVVLLQFTPRPRRHTLRVSHSPFLKRQPQSA